ncbi:MAG: PKD domain-containing protein [Flavisolibacter sp.]
MKKLFLLLSLCFSGFLAFANHITGGEMYYTFLSRSGNNFSYHVVLKLYRDCNAPPGSAQLDPSASIAIFDNTNNSITWEGNITKQPTVTLNLGYPSPCIQSPPEVCYQIGYYEFDVTLPGTSAGYTIAYQRCCRIGGINNLINSNSVGATYTAQIPGTAVLPDAPVNNSAHFIGADTVIVCANNAFCYNFGAEDPDSPTLGDSLSYSFCNAFLGGSTNNPAPATPASPPYVSVPYAAPYNAAAPLGRYVSLDPRTGMLCGIAPAPGIYVVTVCVTEWRQGKAIATQRKDLQIKVGDCNVADAALKPEYISCDGFTYDFHNEAPSNPLIKTYYWDFGDGNTSTEPAPAHTYADTGTYSFKLVINRGEDCSDSAFSKIKVYPGFFPGFVFRGVCLNKPTQFTDTTSTRYGVVNSWTWDFGDPTTPEDVSALQNPVYTYTQTGVNSVRLIVSNSKGCIDTVFRDVTILDKPPLSLGFADTLICKGDTVQLHASGNGSFSWSPAASILNPNIADPLAHPASTTDYIVQLDDNGCLNQDTVQVRVVDFVTLQARADTMICLTDSVQLWATGDGLRYLWSPSGTLSDPSQQDPVAGPRASTTYTVTSFIGHCSATDQVTVTTVPYPEAHAGQDTAVCFSTPAQLHGTIKGSSFNWTPVASLSDPLVLDPIASPSGTTSYILSVFDHLGCPKPGRDTVTVKVMPKVHAFAGKDTAVVVGQPLQLHATGGESYTWSPPTALNRTDVGNPVGLYNGSFDSIEYKVVVVDENNCADSDYIKVKIFRTDPKIFVPSAFTPNGDGKNDVFRPIAVGISKIEYFRVYNRWGELVFSTTTNESGWDGKIGGKDQASGTFVWVVKGVDYTGKVVFAKGTATLIR